MSPPRLHDPPPAVVPQQPRGATSRRLTAAPLATAGLRVRLENATLSTTADAITCASSGQKVFIGNGSPTQTPCSATVTDNCEFTCAPEHVLSDWKKAVLNKVLPALARWLSSAFRMREPLESPLVVDTTSPCGFSGRVTVPAHLGSQGAPETDVLIFVTARPVAGAALAFAGHCQEDAEDHTDSSR